MNKDDDEKMRFKTSEFNDTKTREKARERVERGSDGKIDAGDERLRAAVR